MTPTGSSAPCVAPVLLASSEGPRVPLPVVTSTPAMAAVVVPASSGPLGVLGGGREWERWSSWRVGGSCVLCEFTWGWIEYVSRVRHNQHPTPPHIHMCAPTLPCRPAP